jgi:hypothetical protein
MLMAIFAYKDMFEKYISSLDPKIKQFFTRPKLHQIIPEYNMFSPKWKALIKGVCLFSLPQILVYESIMEYKALGNMLCHISSVF